MRSWCKIFEILLSRDSKIGGMFITMPVKGVGDALHECYKGFVTE